MGGSRMARLRQWLAEHERAVVATLATLALGIAIMLTVVLFAGGLGGSSRAGSSPDDAEPAARGTVVAPNPAASDSPTSDSPASPAGSPTASGPWLPPSLDPATLLTLNEWAMTPSAPVDATPGQLPDGTVAAPRAASGAIVFDEPRGEVLGLLPVQQIDGQDAAYPVLATQDDWLQVALPTRRGLPSAAGAAGVNEATGWVQRADVSTSTLSQSIVVDLAAGTITLRESGRDVLTAEAQVSGASTPTPATRTFVTGTYAKPAATFSNLSIGLGAHSAAIDAYGGTPASLAIHALTLGSRPVPDSCIRVSLETLDTLSKVPAGTPVLIEAGA